MAITIDQFALGSFHYIRYPFSCFLDSAVRLGMKNIEIWGVAPHVYADDLDGPRLAALRAQIEQRGLNPVCFCPEQTTYPLDISSEDPSLRERSVRFLQRSIEVGAALGAPLFLLCPGRGWLNAPIQPAWDACRRSIEALVPVAEREGVTMVLETQKTFDTSYMLRARDQRQMLDEVASPRLKAMIDFSQMTCFGDTIHTNLELLGEDIRHIHMTALYSQDLDLSLEGDELLRRYPHGRPVNSHINFNNGNNPIIRYLRQLDKAGYSHYITIEICARTSYADPETHAKNALEMIRKDFLGEE